MSRLHDIGGMYGFGPVDAGESDEPPASSDWHMRLYALNRVLMAKGVYNSAEFRHARERLEPATFLQANYHERVYLAVTMLLEEKGVVTADELEASRHGK